MRRDKKRVVQSAARRAFRLAAVLFVIMILLAGCGGREEKATENSAEKAPVSTPVTSHEAEYAAALKLMEQAERHEREGGNLDDYVSAAEIFSSIDGYKDSHEMAEKCCDGYIRSCFGKKRYVHPYGGFKFDAVLQQLNKMKGYGAADDFASLVTLLSDGDVSGVSKLSEDPSCCDPFRAEAAGMVWDYAKWISGLLVNRHSQTELDNTMLSARAAKRFGGDSGHDDPETDGNLFSGGNTGASNVYVSEKTYEKILADCGTEAAGKVLITKIIQPYQYSASAALVSHTEYCLLFPPMERLPEKLFPATIAETEYIIQCESDYQYIGSYDRGTKAVREYTTVKLLKFPGGEVLSETTVYGENPPETIEYTGSTPAYKSGGKPSEEEISAVIIQYCDMIE